jgi:hypothetical protein
MPEAIREGDIPGVQLRCRQPLAVSPAAAWLWLVEEPKLRLWLAEDAVVTPGPQGALALAGPRFEEAPRRERGRTLGWTPPREWVLAFEQLDAGWTAPTRLTLAVHAHPQGSEASEASEVDVLQHGFQRLPLSLCLTAWEAYRRHWRTALARLAAAVPTSTRA